MKQKLIDFYLYFTNDYLTIVRYSEAHNMSKDDCLTLLNIGEKYHNEKVQRLKDIEESIKTRIANETN